MLAAALVVITLALALSGWAGIRLARRRPVVLRQLLAGGVVELALLAQAVVGALQTARGYQPTDPVVFWGYLVVALLVLPGAAVWAMADRSRWSSAVLLAAGFTVAVMEVRMLQVWQGVTR